MIRRLQKNPAPRIAGADDDRYLCEFLWLGANLNQC